MFTPTIVMAVLAVALLLLGYLRGQDQHVEGLKAALRMTTQTLPLLVFAFIVAGMAQVLLPRDLLATWVGTESGPRGLLIGTIAGGLTAGGPYVSLPTAALLLRSGASVGTVVAFLTGWALWSISNVPMYVGILGWKLTLVRTISTFFFPPVAGWLAQTLSNALW